MMETFATRLFHSIVILIVTSALWFEKATAEGVNGIGIGWLENACLAVIVLEKSSPKEISPTQLKLVLEYQKFMKGFFIGVETMGYSRDKVLMSMTDTPKEWLDYRKLAPLHYAFLQKHRKDIKDRPLALNLFLQAWFYSEHPNSGELEKELAKVLIRELKNPSPETR